MTKMRATPPASKKSDRCRDHLLQVQQRETEAATVPQDLDTMSSTPATLTPFQATYHWRNKNCYPWAAEWVRTYPDWA